MRRPQPLGKTLDRPVAHLGRALAECRERGIDIGRDRDVVEPDHADIARDRAAPPADRAHRPDRHEVVVGEDRGHVGRPVEDLEHRGLAATDQRRPPGHGDRVGVEPGRGQGVTDTREAGRGVNVPLRGHEVPEPPVPEFEQMLRREPGARPVVGMDRGQIDIDRRSVDQDDGEWRRGQPFEVPPAETAGRDDQPVDPALDEQVEVARLALRVVVGVAQQDRVALRPGGVLDRPDQLGEVRVLDVGDDQPERFGRASLERARDARRPVVAGPARRPGSARASRAARGRGRPGRG